MVDPAITGLIGTGVGGFIGFAGTWLTNRSATRREKAARLFAEKRKAYAAYNGFFQAETRVYLASVIDHPPWNPPTESVADNRGWETFTESKIVTSELRLVAPEEVREAAAKYDKAHDELRVAVIRWEYRAIGSEPSDDQSDELTAAEEKVSECWESTERAFDKLSHAMRQDLGVPD